MCVSGWRPAMYRGPFFCSRRSSLITTSRTTPVSGCGSGYTRRTSERGMAASVVRMGAGSISRR